MAGRAGATGAPDSVRDEAFMSASVAQIVVTPDGLVAMANRRAEALFGVPARDTGQPFGELDVVCRPLQLRLPIAAVELDRRVVWMHEVEYERAGAAAVRLDIRLAPLIDVDLRLLGVALSFHDVTAARRLQDELGRADVRLDLAYEQLRSMNERRETADEELTCTVEELEIVSEELQSTNEELETLNSELQSAGDELRLVSDRLRDSSAELGEANAFLDALLAGLRAGVAVLDRELVVRVWNRRAEQMWGLRREEAVGRGLHNLDAGLPARRLASMIGEVLRLPVVSGVIGPSRTALMAASDRHGHRIDVRVRCVALAPDGVTSGVILIMEPVGAAA